MKETILTYTRKLLKVLGACTAIIALSLLEAGRLYLIGGIIAGYITGFVWYGVMLRRLWQSAEMTEIAAKKTMVSGVILRLLLMGAGFWAAMQAGIDYFIAVTGGFALVYLLGMIMLIRSNFSNAEKSQ